MVNEKLEKERKAMMEQRDKQMDAEIKANQEKMNAYISALESMVKDENNKLQLTQLKKLNNNLPEDRGKAKGLLQAIELGLNKISFAENGINWFVGVPSGRFMFTQWVSQFLTWFTQYPCVTKIAESNRVDLNRSDLIHYAKSTGLNMIMVDTDAMFQTPLPAAIQFAEEDFKAGYDIVIAPVRSIAGSILIQPVNADEISTTQPFEIVKGSLTFVAISKKALKVLEKLNDYGLVDGEIRPMYCTYLPTNSEDYQFCEMMRDKYNIKIACDPRIKIGHYKPLTLPPV